MPDKKLRIIPNNKRERCVTGIQGLDTILNGGIPRGNSVLITGSCGTGKTTLSLEFLVHGALDDENCLFISVTESSKKMLNNIVPYDFFDESLIEKGRLNFIDMPDVYDDLGLLEKSEFSFKEINALVDRIEEKVVEHDIKRLVIDSITSVCFQLKTEEKIRDFILQLMKMLSSHGCTSLLVSEISPEEPRYSLYGVEEAIADGIVLMGNLERHGDLLRTLQVVKMRGTDHSRAKYVLDLTSVGVLLVPLLKGGGLEGME
ncbi:MAG: RAD55 family ATPase [Thermoplasmata archaeon]